MPACSNDTPIVKEVFELIVPDHFPDPDLYIPPDNPLTQEKVDLGKMLFFDPILSSDSSISCSSCHLPSLAFSDPRKVSLGVNSRPGRRQAPALINQLYNQSFFWHGSVESLERQVLAPIESPDEMNSTIKAVIERLEQHPEYPQLFEQAFGTLPTPNALTDAIASFERTLISANSPYDAYVAGDENALSESQKRGMELFFGEKAECFHCHGGFNFNSGEPSVFQNNGLYEMYKDQGRWEITGKESDRAKFKTPTLRNIAYTMPYMHDGSFSTLEQVIDHYASGGADHPNKSSLVRRFILSEEEKTDLVNFLNALSDPSFVSNSDFQMP